MRAALLATLAAALLLTACGGDDEPDSDTILPILNTMAFIQDNETPGQVEPRGAIIPASGPQDCEIPATPGNFIEGTCEWDVGPTGDGGWVVKYIETWSCEDIAQFEPSPEFCVDDEGRHEWNYLVAADGSAELVFEGGEPPPESLTEGASQ